MNIRLTIYEKSTRGSAFFVRRSKYLIESFSEDIHRLYKVGYTEQAFTQYANAKITQYKKLYELIGIEMPDSIQNANTITKVKTIFHQG